MTEKPRFYTQSYLQRSIAGSREVGCATSKLLWCLYPHDIVIYDAFVHRALAVMQCIDDDLSEFPRIGTAPALKGAADIPRACDYYMNYQGMVSKLNSTYAKEFDELRQRYNEPYPYDVRIMDKLLWMIGNPKWPL